MRLVLPRRASPTPSAWTAMGSVVLEGRDLSVRRGGRVVLDGADLVARAGEVVALVGPNGAGKSTLLGALVGDLACAAGEVLVDGRPLEAWDRVALARRRAVLPQQAQVAFPFTVREIVGMGRSPWSGTDAEDDDEVAIDEALDAADVAHLSAEVHSHLSGGEQARVALARVLAQRTQVLLLDEPTAALDVRHQELVMGRLRARAAEGAAAVVVLHDLALAGAHADRVLVLARGLVVADGPPRDVLEADLLTEVYGHPLRVVGDPWSGAPLVLTDRNVGGLRGRVT